jgi:hypothetical protein
VPAVVVAVGWVARVTAPVRQGPASAWAAGEWVGVVVGVRAAAREAEQAAAVARGQVLLALPAYGNRDGVVEQEAAAPVVAAGVVEEGREAAALAVEVELAVGAELVAVE